MAVNAIHRVTTAALKELTEEEYKLIKYVVLKKLEQYEKKRGFTNDK